jgi:hypothetical protein
MPLHNIDFEGGLRRLADRKIEEAMREGKFDNLAGMGEPLELEEMPAGENQRMLWWALKIMRNGNFTPDEVRWRKEIDRLREKISVLKDEAALTELVGQVNQLVHKINTLGTNALQLPAVQLDLQAELARFRSRSGSC